MNILAQCCGVVLLIVILYFHSSQKRIHLHTEQAFMGIWGITFVSLFLDILSMVLLTYRDALPEPAVQIGCKAYVASLVWVGIFYIEYVCADIYVDRQAYQKYQKIFTFGGVLFSLGVFLLPLYINANGASETYTYGPSANLTYGLAALDMLILGYLILRHRDIINPRRCKVMWVWIGVWLLAAILEFVSIQFIHSALLLVGYASAVGIVIIYLCLENPEANLDQKTGLFNQNAFLLYTRQLLKDREKFYLLCMSYALGVGDNVPADIEEIIFMEIVKFISQISGTTVFRLTENEIVFLFLEEEEEKRVYKYLSERFEKPWGRANMRMVSPRWYSIMNPQMVKSEKDFLSLFQYVSQNSIGGSKFGNNDVVVIDEAMLQEMYKKQKTENLLIQAMKKDRVEVFYQPIYSVRKYQFVSAEALVRIRDGKGKIIPPGTFIEVAERTGLIVKLGEIVFEKVCQFIQEEEPAQYGIEYIEVNLSIIQCGYENLAENFIQIMKKYDVSPKYINLEITETASLDEKRMLLQNMEILREYGVAFSLDDFGTGRSNLNYIVDMPVDIVKFDRDMIQAYFHSDKAKYVMDAAMHMIHGMKLKIVSEGIETEEQYRTMEELGISYIQGYYFSKPLPEKEFLEFIRREGKKESGNQ